VQNILFLTERYPPDIGGLAASASRISHALASTGCRVDVLVWSRQVEAGQLMKEETGVPNLRVQRVGMYRQWDMTMPATMNIIEWLHQENPYDMAWGHYIFPSGFLAVWFAKLKNLFSTVSARGNDLDKEVFPPGDFSRLKWTLDNADSITAVSEEMAHKIKVLSGRGDSVVLPNVVNPDDFAPRPANAQLRSHLNISENDLVLAFSGELREKKGMRFLLETMRTMQAERPTKLLLIGDARAQQKAALQLFAAEHPEAAANIIITGHLASPHLVSEHLQLVDLYLQPSLFEGMPNALLEAMACEKVCMASDAGGIPEVIEHGRNGFMVSRAHLNHLHTAIVEILEMPREDRTKIARAARKTILEKFCPREEELKLKMLLSSNGLRRPLQQT